MALIVKNAIKKSIKDMRFSGDFFKALDSHVAEELKRASDRAKGNKRRTIRPCDI